MHIEASDFCKFVKSQLLYFFTNKNVLDVGGGDINGNNKYLFTNCNYNSNDVIEAPNVTIVSKTKDLPFEDNIFDTIISTECFEHDPEYKESLIKIYNMLKPEGLFFFTCAGFDRPEHGTRRTTPGDSYGTIGNDEIMVDYYKNLTINDINDVLDLNKSFKYWDSYYNSKSKDLYFIGIKNNNISNKIILRKYIQKDVKNTNYQIK